MIELSRQLKQNTVIWLFPIFYFSHDIEEVVTVEAFVKNNASILPIQITTNEFFLAFILLFLLLCSMCYQASKGRRFIGVNGMTFFSFAVPGLFLANGIGHVIQFLFFDSYVPGIITTVLIIFPYSSLSISYLFYRRILTWRRFFFYLFIGFFVQALIAFIALLIAKTLLN